MAQPCRAENAWRSAPDETESFTYGLLASGQALGIEHEAWVGWFVGVTGLVYVWDGR